MTQDKDPIRSRRQLRAETEVRAESAAADAPVDAPATAAPASADAPASASAAPASASAAPASADAPATARARRAANSPVDAPAPGVATERSSQTRARDRAALRAYRELSTPRAGAAPALPSRKDLRRAQRAAEGRTADTAMTPVVPVALPQGSPTAAAAEAGQPTAALSSPGTSSSPGTPSSQRTPASGASGTSSAAAAAGAASSEGPNQSQDADQMSVAEALAARQALLRDAHDHATGLETPEGTDPLAVDLTILAQQRELAARAAVLNARAAARERIAAENASKKSESIDPTTTHNLAMVTPLEFMNIPGSDRPVLRPPVTSHVPVVTRNNPAARVRTPPPLPPQAPAEPPASATNDAGEQASASKTPQTRAGRHGTGQVVDAPSSLAGTARSPRTSHARTLRRAEEAFQAGREPAGPSTTQRNAKPKNFAVSPDASSREVDASQSQEASPISAGAAHGLEPLDALTAGLGRANRSRNLVWGSIAIGALALIVGIIMIIIGLSH